MNPELRRNLWLQFSLTRLLLAPVAIGALLTLTWIVSDASLAAVAEVAAGDAITYWSFSGARAGPQIWWPRRSPAAPGTASACPRSAPGR